MSQSAAWSGVSVRFRARVQSHKSAACTARFGRIDWLCNNAVGGAGDFGPLDGLTEDEQIIIRYSRELLEEKNVQDATFEAVRARWGEAGVLEMTATMSVYLMNATILRAMGHQAAAGARMLTPRA